MDAIWTLRATVDGERRAYHIDNEADARAGAAQMVAGGGHKNVRLTDPHGHAVDVSVDVEARRAWLKARLNGG